MVKRSIIYIEFKNRLLVEPHGSLIKLFKARPELQKEYKEQIKYRLYKLKADYVNLEQGFAIVRRDFNERNEQYIDIKNKRE